MKMATEENISGLLKNWAIITKQWKWENCSF